MSIVATGKAVGPGKFAQVNGVFITFRNDDTLALTNFLVPAVGLGKDIPKSLFTEARISVSHIRCTFHQVIGKKGVHLFTYGS